MTSRLWNEQSIDTYETGVSDYQLAVLEQWKTCVDTAERVSTRRGVANAFFLTLNTLIMIGIGVFWKDRPQGVSVSALAVPLVAVLAITFVWWSLLHSYRALNDAKFEIITALEERLPALVFKAEWDRLVRPGKRRNYRLLTSLELAIPAVFGATYLVSFLLAVLSVALG